LVLRWLRHRADLHSRAADAQIGAAAYRKVHEALDVVPAHTSTCSNSSWTRMPPARRTCVWTAR
jgi:hypothetical protein